MRWPRFFFVFVFVALFGFGSASYSLSRIRPEANFQPVAFGTALAPVEYTLSRMPADLNNLDTQKLLSLGRRSLATEPLNPKALVLLALHSRGMGDHTKAMDFAKLSQKISRRDGTTQLLLVDGKQRLPDVKIVELLYHYDLALRVNPELSQQLYPALIQIMDVEQGRSELAPFVKSNISWIEGLLFSALEVEGGAVSVAETMLLANPGKTIEIPENLSGPLFRSLFSKHEFGLMRKLFLRMKEAKREWLVSTNFRLAEMQFKYGPMVWESTTTPSLGSELSSGKIEGEPEMRVYALSGARGLVLKRLFFLKPGKYQFTANVDARGAGIGSAGQVSMECASAKGESFPLLLEADILSTRKNQVWSFVVPCDIQLFGLIAAGGDRQEGLELSIKSIKIN